MILVSLDKSALRKALNEISDIINSTNYSMSKYKKIKEVMEKLKKINI